MSGEQALDLETRPEGRPAPVRASEPDRPVVDGPRGRRARALSRYRFVRAYTTTFLVIGSYVLHAFLGRVLGRGFRDSRIDRVHQRNASRVNRTIVELQGLFIKVGQLLSVMANFLPAPFREGLSTLQDRVPPRPTSEVKATILREFGKSANELFASFSDEPMASASLGQVHEARLADGTRVAVKVQHADIDEVVRLDLTTIRRIMRIVTIFVPVKNLDVYYRQIKTMIAEELDFLREARNIHRIADNFAKDSTVVFPRPIDALSTKSVMTTTFVTGVQIGDPKKLDDAGIDRPKLARKIVEVFCQQILVDGVYHADPHPGNMLAGAGGELVLLDFGAVAELSREMREGIPEFIEGVIRRDTDRLIKSLRKMGFIPRDQSDANSERIVEFFHQRFQEEVKLESFNLKDIKLDPQRGLENLISLRKMNIGLQELSEAFHIPRDWVFLERTLLLLTGVCTTLDPDMNPVEIIQPYVQDFVLGNRDWAQIALDAAKDMALKAVTLPEDLRKYLQRANRGEAELRIKELSRSTSILYAGIRQAIFAGVAALGGFAALELYLAGHVELARRILWGAGGLFGLVVFSMLLTRSKP